MILQRSRTRSRLLTSVIAVAAVAGVGMVAPTAASAATPSHAAAATDAKPTVVLVHGAWADASSFAPVTAKLQADGYTVLNAPNPLRGLGTDAANVAAFVNQATTGPVVLVGHSYGGAVITNAATQTPRVTALVFIDAFAPARGESVLDLTNAQPGSALGGSDPSAVFNFVQYPGGGGDVDTYVKPDLFGNIFAPKLSASTTNALAASQSPIALRALKGPSQAPAWRTIKSYFFVGVDDKVIPVAEQLAMATRAHGVVVKRHADHLSMLELPGPVAALIEQAATGQ